MSRREKGTRRGVALVLATLAATLIIFTGGSVRAEGVEPVVVVGLRQLVKKGGQPVSRLNEAQRTRELLGGAIGAAVQRPILNHLELRDELGSYLVKFMNCRGKPECVIKLVAPFRDRARLAVYGDYYVERENYRFLLYAVDLRERALVAEVEFTLRKSELPDPKLWGRALGVLLEGAKAPKPATPVTPVPPVNPVTPVTPPTGDAPPELPALSTTGDGGTVELPADGSTPVDKPAPKSEPESGAFVDDTTLNALARGLAWHGYIQTYAALGFRDEFRRDFVLFENRLQLEFETDVSPVKLVGRPQLVYNWVGGDLDVSFRELYASRLYKKFDISVGERIVTWGVTDFWPVVDIVNPRDYSRLRNWKPIDEKLPAPIIHSAVVFGPVTLQAMGIVLTRNSLYQLDQTKPFAIPIAVPSEIPIVQQELPTSLSSSGGGVAMDVSIGAWKTSLYGLWGRNPLPTVFAVVDPTNGAPEIRVENERVGMVAASVQGTIDAIDTLIKAEAAYYRRIDDRCEDAIEIAPGTPSCFYMRRVPTMRGTFAIQRAIVEGLDAHLQLITEATRSKDVPALPDAATALVSGLVPQHEVNPIVTLRLQAMWARGDFRPSAFAYWSIKDEDWFANVDFEYHLADGFALSLGGFWFEGYAKNAAKNRFTMAGGQESSSHAYLRATAWF